MSIDRLEQIRSQLIAAFTPEELDIRDDSHKHIGHAGALSGGGHYAITIRAAAFTNKTTLESHRMIYAALAELMKHDIHALSIKIKKSL